MGAIYKQMVLRITGRTGSRHGNWPNRRRCARITSNSYLIGWRKGCRQPRS